ncbi:MAG: hypothetical protein ACRDLS_15510 [Solirubrobacteraceae bacterium]
MRGGDVRECEDRVRAALELPEPPLINAPALYSQLALALIERDELEKAEWALQQVCVGPHVTVAVGSNGGY